MATKKERERTAWIVAQEKEIMRKGRKKRKKPRTAKQKAATRKMLAANKRKRLRSLYAKRRSVSANRRFRAGETRIRLNKPVRIEDVRFGDGNEMPVWKGPKPRIMWGSKLLSQEDSDARRARLGDDLA